MSRPSAHVVASGGADRTILIWSIETNTVLHRFKQHKDAITCLQFRLHEQSLYVYSGSLDRSIKVWDVEQGAYVETLFGHQDSVIALDALSRERCVSAGGRDGTVRLWKIPEESQLVYRCGSHGIPAQSVDSVAMLDDDHFVYGTQSGLIGLLDVKRKKPVWTQATAHGVDEFGSARWITAMSAIPFSDIFCTGSWDGWVRLWRMADDANTCEEIAKIPVQGVVNALHLSESRLVIALGQEHRLGRWIRLEKVKNQVVVVTLNNTP